MYNKLKRLFLIFLILILCGCKETPFSTIPSSNEIVFVKWRFGNPQFGYEICTMDSNGENQQILLKDKYHLCREVLWSSNGEKIIYPRVNMPKKFISEVNLSEIEKREFSEVVMINLIEKSRIKLLKKKYFISDISWFPNKEKIIFKGGWRKNTIYSFDISQKKLKKLVDYRLIGENVYSLSLSSNGKNIVFQAHDESGKYKIYIMNLKEKKVKRLTDNFPETIEMLPVWSPVDNWIAFEEINPKNKNSNSYHLIVLINPNTKEYHKISLPKGILIDKINFSPDRKKIIFGTVPGENADIFTIDIDGKNLKNLTNTSDWDETCPSWRSIVND